MPKNTPLKELLARPADDYTHESFSPILKNLQANILKHHRKDKATLAFLTFKKETDHKPILKDWLLELSQVVDSAHQQIEQRETIRCRKGCVNMLEKQLGSLIKGCEKIEELISKAYLQINDLEIDINNIKSLISSKGVTGKNILRNLKKVRRGTIEALKRTSEKFEKAHYKKLEEKNAKLMLYRKQLSVSKDILEKEIVESKGKKLCNVFLKLEQDRVLIIEERIDDLAVVINILDKVINAFNDLKLLALKKSFRILRRNRIHFESGLREIERDLEDVGKIKKIVGTAIARNQNRIVKTKKLLDTISKSVGQLNKANLAEYKAILSALKEAADKRPEPRVICFYLSYQGYRYFDKKGKQIPGGDVAAFKQGMEKTKFYQQQRERDIEKKFKGKMVHALLLIAGGKESNQKERKTLVRELLTHQKRELCENFDIEFGALNTPKGQRALYDEKKRKSVEWFGFKDGISNPKFFSSAVARTKADFQKPAKLGVVLTHDKSGGMYNCGSFLAFMKFEQHVDNFKASCQSLVDKIDFSDGDIAHGDRLKYAGALLIGKHLDGTPMTLSRTDHKDVSRNSFNYSNDPEGTKCPIHAHVRKANPRNGEAYGQIVRRGMFYGGGGAKNKRGLLFLSFQADLESQFEYLLDHRLNRFYWNGEKRGSDPILGSTSKYRKYAEVWGNSEAKLFTIPNRKLTTFRGGMYFFAPSISFIKNDLGRFW